MNLSPTEVCCSLAGIYNSQQSNQLEEHTTLEEYTILNSTAKLKLDPLPDSTAALGVRLLQHSLSTGLVRGRQFGILA